MKQACGEMTVTYKQLKPKFHRCMLLSQDEKWLKIILIRFNWCYTWDMVVPSFSLRLWFFRHIFNQGRHWTVWGARGGGGGKTFMWSKELKVMTFSEEMWNKAGFKDNPALWYRNVIPAVIVRSLTVARAGLCGWTPSQNDDSSDF